MIPRLVSIGIVGALTLAACGGDDDAGSATTQPAGTTATTSGAGPVTTAPDGTGGTASPADTPSSSEPVPATAVGAPVVVEHAYGSTEIASRPERVVSASVSMTGSLLAIGAPVVASMTTQPGPVADSNGFFFQWASEAVARDVQPIPGPEVNLEAIAAARPDLIVANAVGGQDAVTEELYALLDQIAPTIAVDATATTMADLASTLGAATWRDAEASEAVAEVEEHVAELAETIDTSQPVALFTLASGTGLNVFTATSPQGDVIEALGLTLTEVEAPSLAGEGSGARQDVVQLSAELIDQLGDSTLFVMLADQAAVDAAIASMPTLAALPAVAEGRVYPLGSDVFRIDPFSAVLLADKLAAALS